MREVNVELVCPHSSAVSILGYGTWNVKYTRAFRLMCIAETLINPLFTNVAFRRDSEGDGSGHYESGGSCPLRP